MRTFHRIAVAGAAALLVASCSGDDSTGPDDSGRSPPTTTTSTRVDTADGGPTTIATNSTPSSTTGTTDDTPATTGPATGQSTLPSTLPSTTSPDDGPDWIPIEVGAGRWLAFVSRRTGANELFAVDVDTGEERQLTDLGSIDVYQPAWSPDGTSIAFQCPSQVAPGDPEQAFGSSDICVLDLATGAITNITSDAAADQDPRWSPDGSELAMLTLSDDGTSRIRIATTDGASIRALTSGFLPAWSPDGSRIAVAEFGGLISVVDVATGVSDLVTESSATSGRPAWSPDGTELAFACVSDATDPGEFAPPSDICVTAADGTGGRVLTDVGSFDAAPDWSPDGRTIVFTSSEELMGLTDVHLVSADEGGAQRVATGIEPNWSPDGRSLAFLPADGGIAITDRSAGEITLIVIDPSAGGLTWAPVSTPSGA